MIIDCHMHSWKYPDHFNREAMLRNQPARRRGWTEDRFKQMWDSPIERYIAEMDGVVDKAILMGLKSWDTFGVDIPNEYLADIVKKYPDKFAWCCCVNPTEEGALEEVRHCVEDLGAIGLGEIGPSYGGFLANDERCFPIYDKAQEWGIPLVIHCGPSQPRNLRMVYGDPLQVDDIAINFPELKIVICHLGYYKYEDAIFLIQKHENVFGDISWLASISGLERSTLSRYLPVVEFPYYHLLYPLLYYFAQTFGPTDKLLWGTDWTASPPKQSIQILTNLNEVLRKYNLPEIPQMALDNILYENWKKVFKL